jgi:hypothetical protein
MLEMVRECGWTVLRSIVERKERWRLVEREGLLERWTMYCLLLVRATQLTVRSTSDS